MRTIIRTLYAAILIILLCISTVFWFMPLLLIIILKFIPSTTWQKKMAQSAESVADIWVATNSWFLFYTLPTQWNIEGLDDLSLKKSYLAISNHQTWVDVTVLQKIFLWKAPFIRFFIKDSLKWIPFWGQAWKLLGYPFMKRYSKSYLLKNPHMRGKDLEATRKACSKLKGRPTTILNFLGGTRFSIEKSRQKKSAYKHLMPPRAGGMAYALTCLQDQLDQILDVTIVYPYGVHSLWGFLCGKLHTIHVNIRKIDITPDILGDYFNDPQYQQYFKDWVNARWHEKDKLITNILSNYPPLTETGQ